MRRRPSRYDRNRQYTNPMLQTTVAGRVITLRGSANRESSQSFPSQQISGLRWEILKPKYVPSTSTSPQSHVKHPATRNPLPSRCARLGIHRGSESTHMSNIQQLEVCICTYPTCMGKRAQLRRPRWRRGHTQPHPATLLSGHYQRSKEALPPLL